MSIDATPGISMERYLDSSFHPDRDFVDGQTDRRNVGEFNHSLIQTQVAFQLMLHAAEWHIVPLTEQRVQVTEQRVRIPDVCALRADAPREAVTRTPPLSALKFYPAKIASPAPCRSWRITSPWASKICGSSTLVSVLPTPTPPKACLG